MARVCEGGEIGLMLAIIKKYYVQGKKQEEIAREECISKSTVCRFLKKAVECGYVGFSVDAPEQDADLADLVAAKFSLERVFVTPAYVESVQVLLKDACRGAARDICMLVKSDGVIAWSGDEAACTVARLLVDEFEPHIKCARVAAMHGISPNAADAAAYAGAVRGAARFFSAKTSLIPAPPIADTRRVASVWRSCGAVGDALSAACGADIAVLGILHAGPDVDYSKRGIFTPKDMNRIEEKNPVGEIACRFYGADGKVMAAEPNARTISVPFDVLKDMRHRLGIAVGADKTAAITGAIKGGYINRLYTDEETAKALLAVKYIRR